MFFSLEGIDGTGKSTQHRLLCEWLGSQGHQVVACRDPGSTPLGEAVRELLLHRTDLNISRRSEMLLYMTARSQLIDEVIAPSLTAGKVVVSDRFVLANLVYQGYAGGLDLDTVRRIGQIVVGQYQPHVVFLLDMPVSAAAARIQRTRDRMEQNDQQFFERLRAGYLAEAKLEPGRIIVVNADRDIEAVQNEIRTLAAKALKDFAGTTTRTAP